MNYESLISRSDGNNILNIANFKFSNKLKENTPNLKKRNGIFWIPPGSVVQTVLLNDGFSNSRIGLDVTPPDGYVYVGYGNNQGILTAPTTTFSVTCTCNNTTSGPCTPFMTFDYHGNFESAGCSGTCSSCTMTKKGTAPLNSNITSNTGNNMNTGGYISLIDDIGFAKKGVNLPSAFPAMFDIPEIKNSFVNFLNKKIGNAPIPDIIEGDDYYMAPSGYCFTVVNLYGRAVVTLVPDYIAAGENTVSASVCNCTGCPTGAICIKNQTKVVIKKIVTCQGCTSCTLTLTTGPSNGIPLYSIHSYVF